jgi:hypothetical protein
MLSRGYSGSVPALDTLRFGAADALFVAAVAALILPVRMLEVAA